MKEHKRVFGYFEIIFNTLYLCTVLAAGIYALVTAGSRLQLLVGVMALVLAGGDGFHLIPRILVVQRRREDGLQGALGFGKLVASLSMTVFYVLLWHIGLLLFLPEGAGPWTVAVYALCAIRILLCLFPQNRWTDRRQPVDWGIYRNLPFFLLGAVVAGLFWLYRGGAPGLYWMWLAIVLSYAFYLPVVLWVNRSPKLGMLMFPKTCTYIWIILMCLSL
jgi:hypothetical protein